MLTFLKIDSFCSTVPSHPPLNVTAFNTSSSSLYVQWTSIPSELIPGILLGYRLFYWKIGEPSSVKDVRFNNSVLDAELKDLQEHTEYCIQLAGFTRIGNGNRSECFKVTTDIGGEPDISIPVIVLN